MLAQDNVDGLQNEVIIYMHILWGKTLVQGKQIYPWAITGNLSFSNLKFENFKLALRLFVLVVC